MAASLYLVWVLEILKFRRLRAWQLRRADPDTSEHEIDEQVERELETGEFRSSRKRIEPDCAANRTCGIAHRLVRFPATIDHGDTREEVSRTDEHRRDFLAGSCQGGVLRHAFVLLASSIDLSVAGSPSAARDLFAKVLQLLRYARAAPFPTHQEPQMHSLNHAVLGHVVAAERAGRPEWSVRSTRSDPNARPVAPLRARGGLRDRPSGAPPGP